MKIIDLKTAMIGANITVRIVTDKGIDGFAQVESAIKGFDRADVRPLFPYFKSLILGCDPTDVESVMRRVRKVGAFKPWGKTVSAIEMALWDITGKEYGIPLHKLLGGKVRDRVRVYNGSFKDPNPPHPVERTADDRAENILSLHELPEGFTIVKTACCFHVPEFMGKIMGGDEYAYNTYKPEPYCTMIDNGSLMTSRGLDAFVGYIARIKEIVGDKVGLAFDCGPGMMPADALRIAKAVEPYNLLWLEDTIAGDYSPYTMAQCYRDISSNTTTNIHTGEQIYLRQNFRELIEGRCVDVIGPDPADCGGVAELKWIAEYANMHGVMIAPHGVFDGVFGMAALTQVCATLPQNFIAYEYPAASPAWWYDIVDGLPDPLLRDGHVPVWDKPGLGVTFNIPKAEKYLLPEDRDFFSDRPSEL